MSTAKLMTSSIANAVDTHENILNKFNNQMNVFNRAQQALDNLSNTGTITGVTFAHPIEDMISDKFREMEVYPPRCMVTYRQLIP